MTDPMVGRILDVLDDVHAGPGDREIPKLIAMKAVLALEPTIADLRVAGEALRTRTNQALQRGVIRVGETDRDRIQWLEEAFRREADRDRRNEVLVAVRRLLYQMNPDEEW